MSRSDRMFEIIQVLRSAAAPQTAAQLADVLEVTPRTVYRDIATLQSMRVPIEGAAGIGYVMRKGYDLPPLNFDAEETEAITVGLAMIARTGDKSLQKAATRAANKKTISICLSEFRLASIDDDRRTITFGTRDQARYTQLVFSCDERTEIIAGIMRTAYLEF